MSGKFAGWMKRLTSDDDQLDADRLTGEADEAGAQRVRSAVRASA